MQKWTVKIPYCGEFVVEAADRDDARAAALKAAGLVATEHQLTPTPVEEEAPAPAPASETPTKKVKK